MRPRIFRSASLTLLPKVVDLGFAVLPMGSSHAVALAQDGHVELLRRAGFPMERMLVDGAPLLRGGFFFVAIIDDLICSDEDDAV